MIYQNFDLEIVCPQGGTRLRVRVLESPQGNCPFIDVNWPFDVDTESHLLQANAIQELGGKLFEAVFCGDIEHLFRSSLAAAFREGKGLRIRLHLPADSALHMRPWEFLFDTRSREFLAVSEHTPLVRYLPLAQAIAPITVDGPLRMLVALSSPTDHPRLDLAHEWEILCHALEPLISTGQLELHRVPGHCTFDKLRDSLRQVVAHVLHFAGHATSEALLLEQASGKGLEMPASHVRFAFPGGVLPRLIVLDTKAAQSSGQAQEFLKQGVPAVVAMQAPITDDAAMIFNRYFYRNLVDTGAVDLSLSEARLRMQGNGHRIAWGRPVLYMRALNGELFRPPANPVAQQVAPATLEPGIDEGNTLWNAQSRPFDPVFTFDPDPEPAQQDIQETIGMPKAGAQGTKRIRVAATAGLLAAVAGIAAGVKFLPSPGGTPASPSSGAPITPVTPVTQVTGAPSMAASPATSSSATPDMPRPRAQANERRRTRNGRPTRQPATAGRGDICTNAVVSERPASCLFKKQ